MKRAAKIDGNQPAIVDALEQMGGSVRSTAQLGNGFPDVVVCFHRQSPLAFLCEIKDKNGTFTAAQLDFYRKWPGDIHILRDVTDAIRLANGELNRLEVWSDGRHLDPRPKIEKEKA